MSELIIELKHKQKEIVDGLLKDGYVNTTAEAIRLSLIELHKENSREFSNNIEDDTEEDKKMMLAVLKDIDKRNEKSYTEEEFLKLNPDLKKYVTKR
jgi:hypothetical protein